MTLTPKGYRPRLLDERINRSLRNFGALEVAGAKFCGKTWSSLAHGESIVHIDEDSMREMALLDPALALEGDHPHIIDEWQEVPKIWDSVRRRIDETGNEKGQFILTGSSSVDKKKVSHSGAGRIVQLHMRPMSLSESGHSDKTISFRGLFDGDFNVQRVETDVREIARFVCQGGWPAFLGSEAGSEGDLSAQYLSALFSISARKNGLDEYLARRIAVSLARNIGKSLTYKTLYADVSEGEVSNKMNNSIFQQKLEPYIAFFKDQYFIEDHLGWDAPVKSRSRVRSKPRRSFVDPSLPASLLSMSPDRLLREMQVFGNLFEEMCLRDLRIYASAMEQIPEPQIRYYSDAEGLEVDAIIELNDGRWGALEIKLSEEKVFQAEKNLIRLRDKIALNPAAQNKEPSFLAVVVGKATFSRITPNGVYVVPLTSLTA